MPHCASGFTSNTDTNECEGDETLAFCATFETKTIEADSNDYGVSVSVGNGESNDPIPIYRRGLYFDGDGDYLVVGALIVHIDFTITAWVRVPVATGAQFGIVCIPFTLMFGVGNAEVAPCSRTLVAHVCKLCRAICYLPGMGVYVLRGREHVA